MKILIITPLQQEFEFLLQGCTQRGFGTEAGVVGRLPVARLPELGLTLAQGGIGKVQFAVQTQHLLDCSGEWELVICAGAAGGLADALAIGDVVVATSTVEHDYKNRFTVRPLPSFSGAQTVLAGLEQVSLPAGAFKVHFGPVASGDEDVIDPDRRQALREATGALAVAWEGAGGAKACRFNGVPFVEIRGITDAADHTAPSDFETNLAVAMTNIAALMISWSGAVRS
jgi:adenosylhomocysteine nucleosidase